MAENKKNTENWIEQVKVEIRNGNYTLARNKKRKANADLFDKYCIGEPGAIAILLTLTADDFCKTMKNDDEDYKDEVLYVFSKEVKLHRRIAKEPGKKVKKEKCKNVSLYIKINKLEEGHVFIVSFHEQKYKLKKHKFE